MANPSPSIDYWRKFFRSATSDIFEVIEKAILVAASDHPEEFRRRRDRIMEMFYTALLRRCDRCGGLHLHGVEGEEERGSAGRVSEESKISSTIDDLEYSNNQAAVLSNCAYDDEEEALARAIEEEAQKVREILQIKEILQNKDDESDDLVLESLRTLQEMEITVDVLMSTEIGKAVNGVRKCKSNQIRQLSRTIVEGWKVLVDEWIDDGLAAITDKSPTVTEDLSTASHGEGLPSPSLDEGRSLFGFRTNAPLSDWRSSASARLTTNIADEQKVASDAKAKPPQRETLKVMQDASRNADESAMEERLGTAKRKLHQSFQQAENAKKQQSIKTAELPDVPKEAHTSKSTLKIKIPSKLWSAKR